MSKHEVIGIGSAWVNRVAHASANRLQAHALTAGSVVKVDRQRYRTLCTEYHDVFQYAGGSVANTLVALSRLQRSVGFVGKASLDADGLFFLNDLSANGVDILLKPNDMDLATSGCLYLYSGDAQVTNAVHLGVSKTLGLSDMSMSDVISARVLLIEADILDMPHLDQWLASVVDLAKKSQTMMVLVLSNKYVVSRRRDYLIDLLGCVDLVAGNEVEFEALLNTQSVTKIVDAVAHLPVSILMTRSSDGATVVRQGEVTEYPASPCQFIDATAAGDYYLAGYLHGFLNACSLAQAMSLGSHMASQVCAVRGSRCRVAIDV